MNVKQALRHWMDQPQLLKAVAEVGNDRSKARNIDILNQEGQSWIKSVYMVPVGPLGTVAPELQASQAGFSRK